MLNRRGLLLGLGSALAAPAIVHAGNLMPVKVMEWIDPWRMRVYFNDGMTTDMVPADGLMLCNYPTSIRNYHVYRYGKAVGGGWMKDSPYIKLVLTPQGHLTVDTSKATGVFSAEGCDRWLRRNSGIWLNSDIQTEWADQMILSVPDFVSVKL